MTVGQVAVISLGDQPGHDLIQSRFGSQRLTEPAIQPACRPGTRSGVSTRSPRSRRTPANVRPKASSMPTVGGGPCVVLIGTNLEPATDTF